MTSGPTRDKSAQACEEPEQAWAATDGSAWASAEAEHDASKSRMARLTQTLHDEVIPRLVDAHGKAANQPHHVHPRDIESFVDLLRQADDNELTTAVMSAHRHGMGAETLFIGLFAPAARHLGVLWESDQVDFSTVTICLGRLQRLLREWSPAFGHEVAHPPNGRRILLAQHPQEQHSFGLSMVAEFFRRDGWEVLGGVGGAVPDPSRQVSRDWFDAVGFSIGSETRLDWLSERITQVRASSRNRKVVVLVGGPLFTLHPELASRVGADASGHAGAQAPALAEGLLGARLQRR